jgi:hypothetical protein
MLRAQPESPATTRRPSYSASKFDARTMLRSPVESKNDTSVRSSVTSRAPSARTSSNASSRRCAVAASTSPVIISSHAWESSTRCSREHGDVRHLRQGSGRRWVRQLDGCGPLRRSSATCLCRAPRERCAVTLEQCSEGAGLGGGRRRGLPRGRRCRSRWCVGRRGPSAAGLPPVVRLAWRGPYRRCGATRAPSRLRVVRRRRSQRDVAGSGRRLVG